MLQTSSTERRAAGGDRPRSVVVSRCTQSHSADCPFTPSTPCDRNEPIYQTARSYEKICYFGDGALCKPGVGQRTNLVGSSDEFGAGSPDQLKHRRWFWHAH